MYEQQFSRELRGKILSYYNYVWTKLGGSGGGESEQELEDLPKSLRDELSKCIKGPILAQVPFLEHSNPEVMKSIRAKLRTQIFLPGDTIINTGDFGEEMYLIERGKIFVYSEDRSVLFAVLERGDYFGESSLLQGERRVATVVSPGYSDCLVLTKADYEEIMSTHPVEAKLLQEKIKADLKRKEMIDKSVEKNLGEHSKLETTAMTGKGESRDSLNETQKMQLLSLEITWTHPDGNFRLFWEVRSEAKRSERANTASHLTNPLLLIQFNSLGAVLALLRLHVSVLENTLPGSLQDSCADFHCRLHAGRGADRRRVLWHEQVHCCGGGQVHHGAGGIEGEVHWGKQIFSFRECSVGSAGVGSCRELGDGRRDGVHGHVLAEGFQALQVFKGWSVQQLGGQDLGEAEDWRRGHRVEIVQAAVDRVLGRALGGVLLLLDSQRGV